MIGFISKLYHYFHYSEVHAILQFVVFSTLSLCVPIFLFPHQIFEAPVLLQLIIVILLGILVFTQTKNAAQGPQAMWFPLALKNCSPQKQQKQFKASSSMKKISNIKDKSSNDKSKKNNKDKSSDNDNDNNENEDSKDDETQQQPLHRRTFFMMSAVVTGTTVGGIGFYTAKYLAALGFRVIMVVRDEQKGEDARLKILEDDFYADLKVVVGDVSDLKGIQSTVIEDVQEAARGTWLALLVNNAGMISNNGQEVIKTNYLGSYLLTELLLPTMLQFWDESAATVSQKTDEKVHNNINDGQNHNNIKYWICAKCGNSKRDIDGKNNHKQHVFSECSTCAIKTKFTPITAQEAAARNSTGLTASTLFCNEHSAAADLFNSAEKQQELLQKLKSMKNTVGFPRVVNLSSLFHMNAVGPVDAKKIEKVAAHHQHQNHHQPEKGAAAASSPSSSSSIPKSNIEQHLLIANSSATKPNNSYGVSKLCNQMHAMNLVRRYAASHGLVAASCHPGMVRTPIWAYAFGSRLRSTLSIGGMFEQLFFKSPVSGTQTTLQCCTQPISKIGDFGDDGSMNGRYYADCEQVPFTVDNPTCKADELKALEEWTRTQLKEYLA